MVRKLNHVGMVAMQDRTILTINQNFARYADAINLLNNKMTQLEIQNKEKLRKLDELISEMKSMKVDEICKAIKELFPNGINESDENV